MIPHHSTHSAKLLEFLKNGVTPTEAALALGITPGAVTQLMDTPEVSTELQKIREEQLKKSATIDAKYDDLEIKLLNQLDRVTPLLMRPLEIAKVLGTVNAAKRRGVAHTTESKPATILQLNIPVALQAKFVVNATNQVVEAGAQTLVTMPSANIAKLAEAKHVPSLPPPKEEDEFGFTY